MSFNLTNLRKTLQPMNEADLQEVIIHLYKKSKENKALLAAYFDEADEEGMFTDLSSKIERCFRRKGRPGRFNPKLQQAKSYITDYKKIFTHKTTRILELKMLYCYYLAEWLSEYGGGEPSWEDSLINVYEECCQTVKDEKLESLYLKEIETIRDTLNRNYCEMLDDSYSYVFNVVK